MDVIKDDNSFDIRDEHKKRSIGAKCGHVLRRISNGEPLKGKVLKFALEVINESGASGFMVEKSEK